jgi:hypothetical protein
LASFIPNSVKFWKENFFYVNESFLPFPLPLRPANHRIKDEAPSTGEYEEGLHALLVGAPTPVATYPEPLLVMSGLSQKRKYPLHRPDIVVDGEG